MPRLDPRVLLFIVAAYTAAVLCVGYLIWGRQYESIVEQPKPEIRHADGSVTAAKNPIAVLKVAEPSKPKGGRPLRASEFTIQPKNPDCDPVTVRADIDEYKDGPRLSLRSPDGTITYAVDKPLADWVRPVSRLWAVGLAKTSDGKLLAAVDRDFGNLRIGAQVGEDDAQVRILWKIK